jgi:phosphatidate phosphatase APP1
VGTSGADGHFRGEVRLSNERMTSLAGVGQQGEGWVPFAAVTRSGDGRAFAGRFLPIGPEGLSVVSDIDDTIKVSNVRDREELLANTFLRRFEAVPDMASTYRLLAEGKAALHYVSASPWQLYPPLADFLRDAGFPPGSFHLKPVRLADSSVFNLAATQEGYKTREIEVLLKAFPRRRFVLIGDSGEQDPETYGHLARKHGQQVRAIWIRNVTGEAADNPRCRKAFSELPPARWLLFRDAAELREPARRVLAGG